MLFICKNFVFSDFTLKQTFAPENGGTSLAPSSLRPCYPYSFEAYGNRFLL